MLCSGILPGLRVIVQGFGIGIATAGRVVGGVRVVAASFPGWARVVLWAAHQSRSRRVHRVLPPRRAVVSRRAGPVVVVVTPVGPHPPPLLLGAIKATSSHQGRRVAVATRQASIVTIIVVIATSVVIVTVSIVRTVTIIPAVIVTIIVVIVIVAVATVTTIIVVVVIATITRGLVTIINRGVTGDEILVGVPSPGCHVRVVIVWRHGVVPSRRRHTVVHRRRVVLVEAALKAVPVVSVLPGRVVLLGVPAVPAVLPVVPPEIIPDNEPIIN